MKNQREVLQTCAISSSCILPLLIVSDFRINERRGGSAGMRDDDKSNFLTAFRQDWE